MATIEQVEKLREKANITYDEAKTALEASNDDILDAMIYLERAGKVKTPKNDGYYNSKQAEPEPESTTQKESYEYDGHTLRHVIKDFLRFIKKMIHKSFINMFEVKKDDRIIISVPVIIPIVLLIFAFGIVIPVAIIGLFFGCHYSFRGPDLEKTGVNNVMNSASNVAETIKKEARERHSDK